VRAHTQGRGIWAMDRGGDRRKLLEPLLERRERFVIRSTGQRMVLDRRRHRVTFSVCARWRMRSALSSGAPEFGRKNVCGLTETGSTLGATHAPSLM